MREIKAFLFLILKKTDVLIFIELDSLINN